MNKSILISIPSQWVEKILNGEKITDIRKTMPKCKLPIDVYIYCTKAKKNLYSEFVELWHYFDGSVAEPLADIKQFKLTNENLETNKLIWIGQLSRLFRKKLNGKVVAKFRLNEINHYEGEFWDNDCCESIKEMVEPQDFEEYGEYDYYTIVTNEDENYEDNIICKNSCLTWHELRKYIGKGTNEFYTWRIDNLEVFDTPLELSDFYYHDTIYDNSFGWIFEDIVKDRTINKAPQSWRYVLVKEELIFKN